MPRSPKERLKLKSAAATILLPLSLVAIVNCAPYLSAQTISIRLLNAKSGKPMGNKMVTFVWEGMMPWDGPAVTADQQGLGTIEVPAGKRKFSLQAGPKVGKEPNRIPYLDCNESKAELSIQVLSVLQNGVVLRNTCGQQSAVAKPGEIVFWLLPLPWWEPDMQ